MNTGIHARVGQLSEAAGKLLDLFAADQQAIQQADFTIARVLNSFQFLHHHPIITACQLTARIGITVPTATKILATLERLGIVHEITGRNGDEFIPINTTSIFSMKGRNRCEVCFL